MMAIAFHMLVIIIDPSHVLLYVLIMKTPAEGYQNCPVIRGQGRGSCIRGKVCRDSKGLRQSFVVTTTEIWGHLGSKSCWPPCCYGTWQLGFIHTTFSWNQILWNSQEWWWKDIALETFGVIVHLVLVSVSSHHEIFQFFQVRRLLLLIRFLVRWFLGWWWHKWCTFTGTGRCWNSSTGWIARECCIKCSIHCTRWEQALPGMIWFQLKNLFISYQFS